MRNRGASRGVAVRSPAPQQLPESDRLWTQPEAAAFLGVTTRYLRDSTCPKLLLPGNGAKGQPLVRYDPDDVRAWARSWHAGASGMTQARRAS